MSNVIGEFDARGSSILIGQRTGLVRLTDADLHVRVVEDGQSYKIQADNYEGQTYLSVSLDPESILKLSELLNDIVAVQFPNQRRKR
jgi:hypothetical protein